MPSLASAALPRRVRDALQDALALVMDHTVAPLERALEDLELELHRAAHLDDDLARRPQRLACLRVLQRERGRIATGFVDRLEAELATLREPPTTAAPPAAQALPSEAEWRLLEDDEVQDDALLRAITMRYEARAGLALQLLGQRFGVLGGRPALDAEHLPVGPHRLTTLLAEVGGDAGFDADTRRRLMALFEQRVLARYEELADALNAMLVRRGVLPSMSFVPIRVRPRPRARDAAGDASLLPPPGADTVAAPFDALRALLARRRAAVERLRGPSARRGTDGTDGAEAGRPAALPALGDGEALRGTAAGDTSADVLELVELWYAYLLREARPGSASAHWLDALRPAVIRAAARDPDVFNRTDHPVRQVLDAIIEAGEPDSANEAPDPTLHAALARAVDDIVTGNGETRAFQHANEAVQHARRTLARRAEVAERRLVEAARGRERLAAARARAAEAIAGLSQGRPLSRLVRTLVEQAWADVLTLTALRNGEGGEEWQRQLGTTREILDVASGLPASDDLAPRIREALTAIGTHEDEARMIAAHLGAHEFAGDDAATRTELVMRLKARTRLGAEALPDAHPRIPLTPAQRIRLDALPVGEADAWFEFDAGGAGESPQRQRLVWTGAATNTALFVNRRGQRAAEIALDALACALDSGRVRPVAPDPRGGVQRAWDAVLAVLHGFDPDRRGAHG